METHNRIERALERALAHSRGGNQPPGIAAAMRHAVFPGGARVRPRLSLAVAGACGDANPAIADASAAAVELLHCASLVHDDMPCFDNAGTRRGKPSVHSAFGEQLALLTGDALIILAFETVAREAALKPELTAPLVSVLARAAGTPHGLVTGQAWESEENIPLAEYHRAKTASLFTGACAVGAVAAGSDPLQWMGVGEALGAAYQTADDLRDMVASEAEMGKPAGQDALNGKPNCAREMGVSETVHRLKDLVANAIAAVPDCKGAPVLRDLISGEATRLMPAKLARTAA